METGGIPTGSEGRKPSRYCKHLHLPPSANQSAPAVVWWFLGSHQNRSEAARFAYRKFLAIIYILFPSLNESPATRTRLNQSVQTVFSRSLCEPCQLIILLLKCQKKLQNSRFIVAWRLKKCSLCSTNCRNIILYINTDDLMLLLLWRLIKSTVIHDDFYVLAGVTFSTSWHN